MVERSSTGLLCSHALLQRLAADFADSNEWALDGSPTAAHWLAAVADIETCTAREWIRISKQLRTLHASADAFTNSTLSYAKIRTLTRIATPTNETELIAIAKSTQQHADSLDQLLADGSGTINTEIVLHVRGDGCTLDDGTPIPDTVIERIASDSFLRALIHDAETNPPTQKHNTPSPKNSNSAAPPATTNDTRMGFS